MHTEDKDKMETNITTFHRHKIPTTQMSSKKEVFLEPAEIRISFLDPSIMEPGF